MAESLPSKKIAVADIPETENFSGKFFYNFFTPDEKVNNTGSATKKILERSMDKFDTFFIDTVDFNRSVPRYNEFTWKQVSIGNRPDLARISIQKNYKKIHYEDDFALNDYTLLTVQDTNIDQKLAFFVRKAIQNLKNINVEKKQSIQENLKRINSDTESDVTPELLELGLTAQSAGSDFFDNNGNKIESEIISNLKKVSTKIAINNKIISDVVRSSAYDDVLSPLADELLDFVNQAEKIQQISEKTKDSSFLDASEYDFEINNFISQRVLDSDKHDSILQTIGYIIEKEEVKPDRTITPLPPIFIENPNVSTTVDVRVKYGATYNYRIRTVAYVELQTVEETIGKILAIGFLVSSKASPTITLTCQESSPPPPPVDFNINWDYKNNNIRLNWSFPVETQQDIKKFQIFRRKTIEEPYQLIKMYDFDDSKIKTDDNEKPYPELVEKLSFPKLNFIDNEFTKNSNYIYCLCSIDAHGFSSGYSTQWQISFDKLRNKLVKKLISISGAPKAYPNAFLNTDTFVDTIKDEWHSKLKIYFNPEYLRVYDQDNTDLKLIRAKSTDKYVIQMINIDLQKQQNIDINIKDLTKDQRLSINNKKVYPISPDVIEPPVPQDRQTDINGKWSNSVAQNSFKIT